MKRILLALVLASSLVFASCDKQADNYGGCVRECRQQFSGLADQSDCLSEKCSPLLEATMTCKEEQVTLNDGGVEARLTTTPSKAARTRDKESQLPAWTGLVVFLALVGVALVGYFKLYEK